MIIFPMAGLSSRFSKAGYQLPKYMLPMWNGTVLDFAISSFAPRFVDTPFLFIYRDIADTRAFLEARVAALGIANPLLVRLDAETRGQAETVEFGLNKVDVTDKEALTIFNIDTFRRPDARLSKLPAAADGWLEVFEGSGANWSYVEPDPNSDGVALRTTEKIPVSTLCCSGLYEFASPGLFRKAVARERMEPQSTELYIAPIYNHLIAAGSTIGYASIAVDDLRFCGIPSEYEALKAEPQPW